MLGYLSPSLTSFAAGFDTYALDSKTTENINKTLENGDLSLEEMNKLYDIVQKSSTLKADGTYEFNESIALELGATPEQVNNLKNGYKNINFKEISKLEGKTATITDPKTGTVVVISLTALLNALIALGAAWLVNEILNLGAYLACQKWKYSSKAPRIFTAYCESKGW